MSSNIPEARQIIEDLLLSTSMDADAIREILQEQVLPLLHRTRTKKVIARRESPTVDRKMASLIRSYSEVYPKASTMKIASVFGVNPGRVSEAIAGLR